MKDLFGIVGVVHVLRETHNVTTLFHEVLDVIVIAFIGELGHLDTFTSELFIEIE